MNFQVHVEAVSGISDDSQMGEGVWGVLKGRVVRYLLRGETILIGRNTQFHSVCYYYNCNKQQKCKAKFMIHTLVVLPTICLIPHPSQFFDIFVIVTTTNLKKKSFIHWSRN